MEATTAVRTRRTAPVIDSVPREFLTFKLGNEDYGIDILKVREIRGHDPVTPIANAPDFIKGVINLRGEIVPIVDLRVKLNLTPSADSALSVVIILNLGARVIGMVVDSVSEVLALGPGQIRPAPELDAAIGTEYLVGLGTVEGRMLILVDIERLMTSHELQLVEPTRNDA